MNPGRGGKRALCLAVRDVIRLRLGYDRATCEVMFDGQPPPRCGKVFVSVHRGSRSNQDRNSLDERFNVNVTVTLRVNEPFDRIGTDLLELEGTGLDDRLDDLIALLHQNEEVRDLANDYLLEHATADVYGFTEPLAFENDPEYRPVSGQWFHADPASTDIGVVGALKFGRARRIWDIALLRDSL